MRKQIWKENMEKQLKWHMEFWEREYMGSRILYKTIVSIGYLK